ncbi:hypothetical protein NTJ28_002575 [Flavobacterium psychrophilum]|nr:hypothetical protein [Flavobacterium psychrophilum]
MEEHRAKATMVFHHLRSGGSMEKIVPKGDFFHRLVAWRQLGICLAKCIDLRPVLTPIKQEYYSKFRLLFMRLIFSLKLDVYPGSISLLG